MVAGMRLVVLEVHLKQDYRRILPLSRFFYLTAAVLVRQNNLLSFCSDNTICILTTLQPSNAVIYMNKAHSLHRAKLGSITISADVLCICIQRLLYDELCAIENAWMRHNSNGMADRMESHSIGQTFRFALHSLLCQKGTPIVDNSNNDTFDHSSRIYVIHIRLIGIRLCRITNEPMHSIYYRLQL